MAEIQNQTGLQGIIFEGRLCFTKAMVGKLESVLCHIQNDDYYPTFLDKLLHLFYCSCKFHCFCDGNKRIAITLPLMKGILFQPYFSEGAAIVNISSSRDRMSQPQTESYTAAKGGISALTHRGELAASGSSERKGYE